MSEPEKLTWPQLEVWVETQLRELAPDHPDVRTAARTLGLGNAMEWLARELFIAGECAGKRAHYVRHQLAYRDEHSVFDVRVGGDRRSEGE